MQLTFRRNLTPKADAPTWEEFTLTPQRVQRYQKREGDRSDNMAKVFLNAGEPVQDTDQVKFDGRWVAFEDFYEVDFLAGIPSHIEIEVKR